MLYDGIHLIDSSTAQNFTIENGANLPTSGTKGALFFQDGIGFFIYDGSAWRQLTTKQYVDARPTPYDIACAIIGKPAASAVVARFVAVRAFGISANASGSFAKTAVAPTASVTLTLQKNGVTMGTIVFAAGQTSGTFSSSATQFAPGDVFTVVAPSTQDTTFADCEFTIVGTLI